MLSAIWHQDNTITWLAQRNKTKQHVFGLKRKVLWEMKFNMPENEAVSFPDTLDPDLLCKPPTELTRYFFHLMTSHYLEGRELLQIGKAMFNFSLPSPL